MKCTTVVESWEQCSNNEALVDYAQDFTYYSILLFLQNEPIILLKLPVIPLLCPALRQ